MLQNETVLVLEVARHCLDNSLFLADAADPNFTRAALFTQQPENSPPVFRSRLHPSLWLEVLETSSDLQISQTLIRPFTLENDGSLPGRIDDKIGLWNRGISNDVEFCSVRPAHHHVTTALRSLRMALVLNKVQVRRNLSSPRTDI